jgi:hypothetical protein
VLIRKNLTLITGIVIAIGLTSLPALAHDTHDSGEHHKANQVAATEESAERKAARLAEREQQKVQRQADKEARTVAQRQKVCEARKASLTAKVDRIVTSATAKRERIDGIYLKAINFQTTNNLNTANTANLLTAAQTARTASSDSLASLSAAKPTIDCTNPAATYTAVKAFKTSAKTTRDSIKAYRTAVKNLLVDLRQAKAAIDLSAGGEQ